MSESVVETSENVSNDQELKDYNTISQEIDIQIKNLVEIQRVFKSLKKDLDKTHAKELKTIKKKKKGDNSNKTNKEPSGFNKPAVVPKEFCEQPWGCSEGELVPRTQLTKMVYDYIKSNNLQDPDDKRIIHPDKNVKNLFHLESGQNLEFKTFQTYMAKLYKKDVKPEPEQEKVQEINVESKPSDKKTNVRKKGGKKKPASKEVEAV